MVRFCMQKNPKYSIVSNNETEAIIGQCWELENKQDRRKCMLLAIEDNWDRIPYVDIFSIFHFLYGMLLGIVFVGSMILTGWTWLAVIGALLVIPINAVYHYYTKGLATLDNHNAFMDHTLSLLGYVIIYFVVPLFF